MINWIPAALRKPAVNNIDAFDKLHKISKRTLVWFTPSNGTDREPIVGFGRYHHELEDWVMEQFRGDATVQYWSEINNPNEGEDSLASIILNKDHDS